MALLAGSRVGPYEVTGPLGAGGMGEVYRARDARLERDVAIKGLPAEFAHDVERRARFDREARLLASLNHANIAAIYGLEEVDGTAYLVLELVEGETLAQALARGGMATREALEIGVQIAAAIEAAHDKGVIHRDLKPSNVMMSAWSVVKVLDFGLARGGALEAGSSAQLTAPPTMAVSATGAGVVLGTAPYMSPEQARGRTVDRRADVWAFGCILYECLSGRPAFAGETASDILARVIEREPDWAALPGSVPTRLKDLVRRCLTKSEAERPRDIGDLKRELGVILTDLSTPRGAGSAGGAEGPPSLAVLYFENIAADQESDYFCAGITEDILTDLSKIKGLRVASRNAVLRYRGQAIDLAKIAAELGVSAVLEGSVRRAGDRLRITAQLINAADGFHLWAERYDRTMQDVFAVQEEIASSIATALRVTLTPAEAKNLVQNRPDDARAYDLYLRGRAQYSLYTKEGLLGALALFEEAIAIDPNYALAYAGCADCWAQLVQWGHIEDTEDVHRRGFVAVDKALALNPRLPEGHKARALLLRHSGQGDEARRALKRAIEANPRFTPALLNLAVDEFDRANVAGCLRLLLRVREIDPQELFALTWLSFLYLQVGARDEGLAVTARLQELAAEGFYLGAAFSVRAAIQIQALDYAAASATLREGRAAGVPAREMDTLEASVLAHTGRVEEARRMVVALSELPGLNTGTLTTLAGVAVRVGELERAVRLLSRPIISDLAPTILRLDPELHALADVAPFAPRRRDVTLYWPLEAPQLDLARFELFREVHLASARPERSSVLGASAPS